MHLNGRHHVGCLKNIKGDSLEKSIKLFLHGWFKFVTIRVVQHLPTVKDILGVHGKKAGYVDFRGKAMLVTSN